MSAREVANHEAARLQMPVGNVAENFGVEIAVEDGAGHGTTISIDVQGSI
jgi:hypothetical protein